MNKFDAVIVGGGLAGVVAGLHLSELGLRAVILEKGESERYLCNSRYTGGAFHISYNEVDADESVLINVINQRTAGEANPAYAQAVASDTRIAVKWLKAKGIRFIKGGAEAWRINTLAPPVLPQPGLHWEGRGGDVMMRTLTDAFKKLKGTLLLGCRAVELTMSNGRCSGVVVECGGKREIVEADNVIICDGGFQANHAMMREYIAPAPEKIKQRGAGTGNGDGIRMAQAVGAATVGMSAFYGHLLARDAMHNDKLWPFPMVDHLCQASIVVDGSGRRFVDEGLGGIYMTNQIARLADPLTTVAIYDDLIWNGPAREYLVPANPNLVMAGAKILRVSGIADLAGLLGLPSGALEGTVAAYNHAVAAGRTAELTPPRTISPHKAYPIVKGPFYALPLCAGITYTMGGLDIDGDGRVRNTRGTPIAGLYAAGCTTGGLEGGGNIGYVGGLSRCAVMALRATEHIASNRGRT